MKPVFFILFILLSILGLADAGYLTYEHYRQTIPPCTINRLFPIISDCGKVLRSSYSVVFGIPLAAYGIAQYSCLLIAIVLLMIYRKKILFYWVIFQSMIGAIFSLFLMYIQIIILKSICIYCTFSALISFVIFFLIYKFFVKERFSLRLTVIAFIYQKIIKSAFFSIDPEFIHNTMISFGGLIGNTYIKNYFNWKLNYQSPKLKQKIAGINFPGPIGLAAGFDYNVKLTQILYSLGFGFQSIGTITNRPYEGNPYPRLGRLPKSQSLMVNKGYKNEGAIKITEKLVLSGVEGFKIPVGISIGMTNSSKITSTTQAIDDIVSAFKIFGKSKIKNGYYELNISCPNLININIDFYKPVNLNQLLQSISRLKIKKPIFVKMPISLNDDKFVSLLEVIVKYKMIKGVIIGNLLKDRKSPLLDKQEVNKFKTGNFSGKPCEERSNGLIKLTYRKYGKKLIIIGCGGVFNGQDAYKKIKLGASLIQLITGMIFQGPQLISQINLELEELLEKDGYKNIKEAVGKENLIMKIVNQTSAGGVVYKLITSHQSLVTNRLWLICQHSQHKGWVFPKGLVGDNDKNESMAQAALREVEEEGGIKAKIITNKPIITNYQYQYLGNLIKKKVFYYLMECVSGDPDNHDWEISEAKFVDADEVRKTLTYPSDKEAFEKILQQLQ